MSRCDVFCVFFITGAVAPCSLVRRRRARGQCGRAAGCFELPRVPAERTHQRHPDGPGEFNVLDILTDNSAVFRIQTLQPRPHGFSSAVGAIESCRKSLQVWIHVKCTNCGTVSLRRMARPSREANCTLPANSGIAAAAGSWHNDEALADLRHGAVSARARTAHMRFLASIYAPTGNRRLNELIGFLLCVSALLLFLALASYSPLDPSLNSASVLTGTHAARNWIGVVGALVSDLTLQFFGIGAFLLPIFPFMLGIRWFASRKIQSPVAKSLGGIWLVMFRSGTSGLAAGEFSLDARGAHRRPAGTSCGRCADPLLERGWRVYRLCQRAGGRVVSFDGILFFVDSTLGSDSLRVCDCGCGTATRIGRKSAPSASTEGTGEASSFKPGGEKRSWFPCVRVLRASQCCRRESRRNRGAPASSACWDPKSQGQRPLAGFCPNLWLKSNPGVGMLRLRSA